MIADAESQARRVQAESEQRLREEISRLESNRSHLSTRSRPWPVSSRPSATGCASALSEMLSWVDGNLKTGSSADVSPVTNISDASRASGARGTITPLRSSSGSLPL